MHTTTKFWWRRELAIQNETEQIVSLQKPPLLNKENNEKRNSRLFGNWRRYTCFRPSTKFSSYLVVRQSIDHISKGQQRTIDVGSFPKPCPTVLVLGCPLWPSQVHQTHLSHVHLSTGTGTPDMLLYKHLKEDDMVSIPGIVVSLIVNSLNKRKNPPPKKWKKDNHANSQKKIVGKL